MRGWAVLACFLLSACDRDPAAEAEAKALKSVGRYQIEAVSVPIAIRGASGDGIQAYVWRLDTTNGHLQLCNYLYSPAIENAGQRISCDP